MSEPETSKEDLDESIASLELTIQRFMDDADSLKVELEASRQRIAHLEREREEWKAERDLVNQEDERALVLLGQARQERDEDRAAIRELVTRITTTLDACSEERYQELREREAESRKWQAEGDMYGWNFHQGMAAGMNWADIIYRRLGRELAALSKELPAIQRAMTPP